MRRPVLRVLMVIVGLSTLTVYLAGGWLLYLLARTLWAIRPDTPTLVLSIALATVVFAYVSYHVGTARILRQLHVAPLSEDRFPSLYRRIDAHADAMGIDPPEILVADTGQPNALALGGGFGPGTVVLDLRLFGLLTFDELSTILAHELAHIERRDSLVQTLGTSTLQTISGLVTLLVLPVLVVTAGVARGFAWIRGRPGAWPRTVPGRLQRAIGTTVAVALFTLTLALFAHSRRREFAADERAAEVTGQPLALARALVKIERATRSPWELFSPLYVSGDEEGRLVRMLSTHPDTEQRVGRLRAMADRRDRTRQRRLESGGP